MTTEQSTGVVNREEFSGSPSLRSILVKSSIESTSIDPNELYRAVDMLVKGIHHDSKGVYNKDTMKLGTQFVTFFIARCIGYHSLPFVCKIHSLTYFGGI